MRGVVLLVLLVTAYTYDNRLDYENQNSGGWDTATCQESTRQSPIDVQRPEYSMNMTKGFDSFWDLSRNITMDPYGKNNTLAWNFELGSNFNWVDLPVLGYREMRWVEFHWSEEDDTGSEHAMEGEKFGAEMQLVTKSGWRDTVVSRFFEVVPDYDIGEEDMPVYEQLEKMLNESRWNWVYREHQINITIAYFFDEITEYLCYNGSFTTPDCDEGIEWIIIPKPLKMSQTQMDTLRRYRHEGKQDNGLVRNNIRDLQPTYGREIMWFVSDNHVDEDAESHDNEEDAREHLECSDGEGVMWVEKEDHWACDWCDRGWFGWKNKCHACPPGKSTVGSGSAFRDCIDTRYIRCEMREGYSMGDEMVGAGLVCDKEFCPCNAYEECESDGDSEEYGMCKRLDHMYGGAAGVTVSAALVAACLAYFGF